MRHIILAFFVFVEGTTTLPSFGGAATMQRAGNHVRVEGSFEQGDSQKLRTFLKSLPHSDDGGPNRVSFDSPGGNLIEGIEIGRVIRKAGFSTIVQNGKRCFSACAIAFLGGVFKGVAADAVGRVLEVGAQLGFHGFSSAAGDKAILFNEALDVARVMHALVFQFGSEMRAVNGELLSELLSVPPASIRIISSPLELQGLAITVAGKLPAPPRDWGLHACQRQIERLLPLHDVDPAERILRQGDHLSINSLAELRNRFLADRFSELSAGNQRVRMLLNELPNDAFSTVVVGTGLIAFPVQRYQLDRGGGFYYDVCYAILSGPQSVTTILINGVAGVVRVGFGNDLSLYPHRTPLW